MTNSSWRVFIRHCYIVSRHFHRHIARPSFINNKLNLVYYKIMADQSIMCEVEIQPDIQECVEIETIPVDMPDTVETIVECGEPMIPMQSLEGRDIILEPQEEIIDETGDPLNLYDVPVPDASDIYIESSPGPSIKRKKNNSTLKNRGVLIKSEAMLCGDMAMEAKPRKWEQKQVQIKTMEGEFSVTMWASGTSDGKWNFPLTSSVTTP